MGEIRNRYHLSPDFVKVVANELKALGADPFLFDTTVVYPSLRRTKIGYKIVAALNGFLKIGYKVVIGDTGEAVTIGNKSFIVANELLESTYIVVITHITGHEITGFAGSIKNLGMGGVTKKTKRKMHVGSIPVYFRDKCTLCGVCAEACNFHAITVNKYSWKVDIILCEGCGKCVKICPNHALTVKDNELQRSLALSTKAIVTGKKVLYINVLKNITPICDCGPSLKSPFCTDIGYLISDDPVAIDKASLDIIDKNNEDNIFEKITKINPIVQIEYGEEIKLGSTSYELIEI